MEETRPNSDDLLRLIVTKMESMDNRLSALEAKVDERLVDTRPMFKQVNDRLDKIERTLRDMDRSIMQFQADMLRRYFDYDERLDRLESRQQ